MPPPAVFELFRFLQRTCTYSTTLLSPMSRVAANLVAGNASGTTLRTVRFRELVIVREDMVTRQQHVSIRHRPHPSAMMLTSVLVPQIQCRSILDSAGGCAHLRSFQGRLPHYLRCWSGRDARAVRGEDAIKRYRCANQYHLGGCCKMTIERMFGVRKMWWRVCVGWRSTMDWDGSVDIDVSLGGINANGQRRCYDYVMTMLS